MSIRSKILLSLTGVVTLYGACVYGIQRHILLPSFEGLEAEQGQRNVARALEAIGKDIDNLDSFCHDWAAWDDTYAYVADHNEGYVKANLQQSAYENGNFDLARVVSLDGSVVFSMCRDPENGRAELHLQDFAAAPWPAGHPLLTGHDPEHGVTGILNTERGPMLLASRPIVDSLKQQPPRGWLVMGLLLTETHIRQLRAQTRVDFTALPLDHALPALEDQRALVLLQRGSTKVLAPRDDHLMQVYTSMPDLFGKRALLVRADMPRSVMERGRDALSFSLSSTLAAAALLLMVLFFLLRRTIMQPLAALSAHVLSVGRSGNLAARMNSTRRDELGLLSRAFDDMVGKLARTREDLLERAHRDGQSEVAVSVLHNVGNVLNSVSVAASTLASHVRAGSLADAERLGATLAQHEQDLATFISADARGRHLPGYLAAFARSLAEERERMLGELQSLESGVEHIHALVESQQAFARPASEPESLDLSRQVEAALRLSPPLAGARDVEIVREFEPLPEVMVRKHRLLEIMVNLIRNARQALRDAGTADPRLRLCITRLSGSQASGDQAFGDRVCIAVIDNGPGIAAENLGRLFSQGFTTRADGHGFGLHSAAIAAHELGGELTVHSDGKGRGARFVLQLPLLPSRKAA